jgi:hypothetical protein
MKWSEARAAAPSGEPSVTSPDVRTALLKKLEQSLLPERIFWAGGPLPFSFYDDLSPSKNTTPVLQLGVRMSGVRVPRPCCLCKGGAFGSTSHAQRATSQLRKEWPWSRFTCYGKKGPGLTRIDALPGVRRGNAGQNPQPSNARSMGHPNFKRPTPTPGPSARTYITRGWLDPALGVHYTTCFDSVSTAGLRGSHLCRNAPFNRKCAAATRHTGFARA